MKKTIVAALIIGASALYVFMRTPSATAGTIPAPQPTTATAPVGTTGASTNSAPPTNTSGMKAAMQQHMQAMMSPYKDGTYVGSKVDAYYGYVQVQATISGGKITGVSFLSYPNSHRTSVYINSQAMPMLKQEALAIQSAKIDLISGATDTSLGFKQSLSDALAKAANS